MIIIQLCEVNLVLSRSKKKTNFLFLLLFFGVTLEKKKIHNTCFFITLSLNVPLKWSMSYFYSPHLYIIINVIELFNRLFTSNIAQEKSRIVSRINVLYLYFLYDKLVPSIIRLNAIVHGCFCSSK